MLSGTLKISPFGYFWYLANNNIHLLLVGEITGSSFNLGKLWQGRERLVYPKNLNPAADEGGPTAA